MTRTLRLYTWGVLTINISFWVAVIIIVLSSLGPYNTTSYKFFNRRESNTLGNFLPEGFGFFTRSPTEEFPMLYELMGDSLVLVTKPNSSSSNLFGLQRIQRASFSEISRLVNEISKEEWSTCIANVGDCISAQPVKVFELKNLYRNAAICGTYVIVLSKPIPWAWRKSFHGEMPKKFAKLVISCSND